MSKTVLITGASNGIGLELAKLFAKDGYTLVLVARNEQKLNQLAQELKNQYQTNSYVIPKDLTTTTSAEEIWKEVEERSLHIDTLVNNAGYGMYGKFASMEQEEIIGMIQINISSLTLLTRLFLPGMIAKQSGQILNVASTASFQPGPLMAVYYATKSFVLSLSEALANEVKDAGITVSALCPGPTTTGFEKRAQLEKSKLFQGVNMDAKSVAIIGYRGLIIKQTLIIPGWKNRFLAFSVRFIPRKLVTRIVRHLQETRK